MQESTALTAPFRLFGADLSPYAAKARAYLQFKGLDYVWTPRSLSNQEDFARFAKLPLAPVLVDSEDHALQDSTPMLEALEAQFPEPSMLPDDAGLRFLSALFEDYADEWLNKAMFHYRWSFDADRDSAAERTRDMLYADDEAPEGAAETIASRMSSRLHHVGSSPENAPAIEASLARLITALEAHFAGGALYLLGGRPSFGDFGLFGQLRQLLSDPTPGAMLREQAPATVRWIERMEAPKVEGDFLSFEAARAAWADVLAKELAIAYLPWAASNGEAVAEDAMSVRVEIGDVTFVQKPQRYAAKAFAELRRKRAEAGTHEGLGELLQDSGCAQFFDLDSEDEADEEPGEAASDEGAGANGAEPDAPDGEEE
jgi:glutathione S-transferase